jgi:hypothetical protein
LPTQSHVQFALGKAEIELASARAYGIQLMGDLYQEAQAERVPSPARQAKPAPLVHTSPKWRNA